MPPTQWRMGRVMEVHPAGDDKVRKVTIKTAKGDIKRSIHRLVELIGPDRSKGGSMFGMEKEEDA